MAPPFSLSIKPIGRALSRLPGMVRSARLQINNAPSLFLARANAVMNHGSPLLRNVHAVCEEMMAQLENGGGLVETRNISDFNAHQALVRQRVFSFRLAENERFTFSLAQMMVALKRASAGMQDGKTYRYNLDQETTLPVTLELVKNGTQVSMISRVA